MRESEEQRVLRHRNIRIAMLERGLTAAEIGRRIGVARAHVTGVISGKQVSHRVVDALVEAGIPRELFPERYQPGYDGYRRVHCSAVAANN